MPSNNDEVLCPLCHGQGRERKEKLAVRWRSREFEQELHKICDEAAFGSGGGLDVPFEVEETVCNNESD